MLKRTAFCKFNLATRCRTDWRAGLIGIATLLALGLAGCDGGGGGDGGGSNDVGTDSPSSFAIGGSVHKGPFRNGSSVIIVELDDQLTTSGVQFNTSTINDLGHFNTNAAIEAPFVEIITSGFFFDEVSNDISNSALTLRTVSEFVAGETINVNILTQLASRRVEALVLTGGTFDEALA